MRTLLLACCLLAPITTKEVGAQEVILATPMSTVSALPWPPPDGGFELRARVVVP
ncbi:MAG: hypothetical protein H0W72_06105, partial [Planctomycetes bacterium]|nr:hypothetical protein [Planctomycetota bacterium]